MVTTKAELAAKNIQIEYVGRTALAGEGTARRQVGIVRNGVVELNAAGDALLKGAEFEPTPKPLTQMSKIELTSYASEKFGVTLDQRKSLERLREQVSILQVKPKAPEPVPSVVF